MASENQMSKILEGLYIGNIYSARDKEQLKANKITHMISILGSLDAPYYREAPYLNGPRNNLKLFRSLPIGQSVDNAQIESNCSFKLLPNIFYLCILAEDTHSQDLYQHIDLCNDFIHSCRLSGNRVLIHCMTGVSRSVCIAAAYLMLTFLLKRDEAIEFIRRKRPSANPNVSFRLQLRRYEMHVQEKREIFLKSFPSTQLELIDNKIDGHHELGLNEKEQKTKKGERKTSKRYTSPKFQDLFAITGRKPALMKLTPTCLGAPKSIGYSLNPEVYFYEPCSEPKEAVQLREMLNK